MSTAAQRIEEQPEEDKLTSNYGSRSERKALGLVWIDCPYPVVSIGLEGVLADHARLHIGPAPPDGESPTLVVLCPNEVRGPVPDLEYLRETTPDVPVLIFGLRVDLRAGKAAFQAGARGFIHVGMQPAQIVNALSLARAGEVVIPAELFEGLVVEGTPSGSETLTSRQREILTLVVDGMTNAQIAQRLYLSEFTIKQHLRHAFKLLGVSNRTEAAKLFRRES
jgi:DNA-binding NarL/FixJ family response regulator